MEHGKYGHGYQGNHRPELAFAFYRASCRKENGCREALYKMGEFHQKGLGGDAVEKNIKAAIRKYDESQAEGHILAMNALGSLYYNDIREPIQASEWFKKASKKGCTRSINNLGKCYENGHGVPKDRDKAFQLYSEAAEKGHEEAMLNLALMYFENARQTNNHDLYKESSKWFRQLVML